MLLQSVTGVNVVKLCVFGERRLAPSMIYITSMHYSEHLVKSINQVWHAHISFKSIPAAILCPKSASTISDICSYYMDLVIKYA